MQKNELLAWLALHRTASLTDSMLCRLIKACSGPEHILQLSSTELNQLQVPRAAQASLHKKCDQTRLDQDYRLIQEQHIQLLPFSHNHYPELLKQISDPPPLLYVCGDTSLLNKPQLAMVGSRHTSRQGCENAFRFAREFAAAGFVVTSGMALGIDTESHNGALAANGKTIAVLGTGVDVVYPARNQRLFQQISFHGAVVSEFPLGAGPRRGQFPKRNRIISGLSLGVLVVEAALKSGSLITARCALEQGREVFSIPGSIHSSKNRGCNGLIQQGAKLVATAADVMEELTGWLPIGRQEATNTVGNNGNENTVELNSREQQLITLLGFDPAPIDLLQQRSGWMLSDLSAALVTLELKGLVENMAGCYQRIN